MAVNGDDHLLIGHRQTFGSVHDDALIRLMANEPVDGVGLQPVGM